MFRQAASYVDRILRGDKPADLPVQAPTKYETAVNQNGEGARPDRAAGLARRCRRGDRMNRRKLITLLGGAAVSPVLWPVATRARP
jgi:hypothetical protein